MRYNVQHHPDSGEICVWDTGDAPMIVDGLSLVVIERDVAPDHALEKINVATGEIVAKTADEKRAALLPTANEVRSLICRELMATDAIMAVDRPPPKGTTRDAWVTYRQALRDLSKQGLATAEMVAAWPLRPDGFDTAADLRSRI